MSSGAGQASLGLGRGCAGLVIAFSSVLRQYARSGCARGLGDGSHFPGQQPEAHHQRLMSVGRYTKLEYVPEQSAPTATGRPVPVAALICRAGSWHELQALIVCIGDGVGASRVGGAVGIQQQGGGFEGSVGPPLPSYSEPATMPLDRNPAKTRSRVRRCGVHRVRWLAD